MILKDILNKSGEKFIFVNDAKDKNISILHTYIVMEDKNIADLIMGQLILRRNGLDAKRFDKCEIKIIA
jgi:hypothetical protein